MHECIQPTGVRLIPRKIRALTLIEAHVVTSPALIALRFARDCRHRVDLRLVTFVRSGQSQNGVSSSSPFLSAAAEYGVPVNIVHESGRYDLTAVSKLKQICDEHSPDIVQTNSVKSHFLVSLLRKRTFGWLAFHHGYTDEDRKMRLYNQLDRFSLRACDQVVTVCQPFAQQLQSKGVPPEKISVIPNGIPADFASLESSPVDEYRERFGVKRGESVVLSLGRLSPEKGQTYLIQAVSRLYESGQASNMVVLIAGAGLLEQPLKEQIRAAGLEGKIKLIGHQSDVKPLFRMADVFVLPSLSEGSPMVLLESMAAGVPAVATNVGGIPEAVENNKTALLVPPADPRSLADAMLALLMDRARAVRLATAASEHVRRAFSPELYNTRVLQLFQDVLARRGRRVSPSEHVTE